MKKHLTVSALLLVACIPTKSEVQATRRALQAEYVVLDYKSARDKYGKEIAEQYFVIPVTVINGDARKASLQYIRFTPTKADDVGVGTVPMETVLQTYEKKKMKGKRARFVQSLAVLSLVAPSFDFFFKAASSRETFLKGLGIYNSGRTGIFETFPDYLTTYLQLLRSNKIFTKNFEVAPGGSESVDVFVLKDDLAARLPDIKDGKTLRKTPSIDAKVSSGTIKKALGNADIQAFAPQTDNQDILRTQ